MPLLHLEPLPRRTTKGEVLHFLCSTGGIRGEQVGRIDLCGAVVAIEVPPGWDVRLVKALDGALLKGRRLRAWSSRAAPASSAEDHFRRLARLLNLESEAEAQRALEGARRLPATE